MRWLRCDGRIALTILDPASFYRHVSIKGRVIEISDDSERRDIDGLAVGYAGRGHPRPAHPRLSVLIGVERSHAWDRSPGEPARPDRQRLPA